MPWSEQMLTAELTLLALVEASGDEPSSSVAWATLTGRGEERRLLLHAASMIHDLLLEREALTGESLTDWLSTARRNAINDEQR